MFLSRSFKICPVLWGPLLHLTTSLPLALVGVYFCVLFWMDEGMEACLCTLCFSKTRIKDSFDFLIFKSARIRHRHMSTSRQTDTETACSPSILDLWHAPQVTLLYSPVSSMSQIWDASWNDISLSDILKKWISHILSGRRCRFLTIYWKCGNLNKDGLWYHYKNQDVICLLGTQTEDINVERTENGIAALLELHE